MNCRMLGCLCWSSKILIARLLSCKVTLTIEEIQTFLPRGQETTSGSPLTKKGGKHLKYFEVVKETSNFKDVPKSTIPGL